MFIEERQIAIEKVLREQGKVRDQGAERNVPGHRGLHP